MSTEQNRVNPSRPFIVRPVATSLIMVALLLVGLVAYRLLPLSALPEVDYPIIQVVTFYPGASPDVMASTVTAPLERQFGQMPGLKRMTSTSSAGASTVTLQFVLDLSLDVAEQSVQAAINAAGTLLPPDLPTPPIFSKVNPADAPILTLALTSATLPLTKVQAIADTRIAPKLSQVTGVGLVAVSGGQRPAVRVQVNPKAVMALGLGLEDVRTAIDNANVSQAKGTFEGPVRSWAIDANDQLASAAQYRDIVIAWHNGAPLRLRDVADVIDGAENDRLAAWSNDAPAILLSIQRQPGANVIEVADRVKQLLPQLTSALPAGVDVAVLTDRTVTIRAAVSDTRFELMLAVGLVVGVILVFLHNVRATIIPAVAVPLSLVGTFGVMYIAGFSLNNLTLMALVIATGFVVDDAIVMIENVSRHLEDGKTPLQAALDGSAQIGFTIISLTVSLVAVLIPLLFMGDVVGRLFREFSITLAAAILLSAVISLTLTPMMCAHLLQRPRQDERRPGFMDALTRVYARALDVVLAHQGLTLLLALATVVLTGLLYVWVPKGFFPQQDTGVLLGISEAAPTVSFAEMAARQQDLARVVLDDPDVASLASFIGIDGTNATLNSGRMLVNLKPHGQRDATSQDVIRRLQPKLQAVQGGRLYLQANQDLTVDDRITRTPYQFEIQAARAELLSEWVPRLVDRLRTEPAVGDVASDLQDGGLQAYVNLDRATASRVGVTAAAVTGALYDAFGQRLVSTIFTQAAQYRVVLELQPAFRASPQAVGDLFVPSTSGKPVQLSSIARIEERSTPLAMHHIEQFPAATISFAAAPGFALGDAVAAIENAAASLELPPSMQTSFQGAALAFRATLRNQLLLILAAIVTMYIVLGVLYESYVHPVTILSTLPSAAIGALAALFALRMELTIVAVIGIILLIGIVKKNAILMIDFALEAQRREGMSAHEAIREACLKRLRPILMTTACALLGALPLAIGFGAGAELRRPLGITLVGGLLVSQLLTLFTTPVMYLAFDRLARGRRESAPAGA